MTTTVLREDPEFSEKYEEALGEYRVHGVSTWFQHNGWTYAVGTIPGEKDYVHPFWVYDRERLRRELGLVKRSKKDADNVVGPGTITRALSNKEQKAFDKAFAQLD